jgi:hypothetical protein
MLLLLHAGTKTSYVPLLPVEIIKRVNAGIGYTHYCGNYGKLS